MAQDSLNQDIPIAYVSMDGLIDQIAKTRQAQQQWCRFSLKRRRLLLQTTQQSILSNQDALADRINKLMGKHITEALLFDLIPALLVCQWLSDSHAKNFRPFILPAASILSFGRRQIVRTQAVGLIGVQLFADYTFRELFLLVGMSLLQGNGIIIISQGRNLLALTLLGEIFQACQWPSVYYFFQSTEDFYLENQAGLSVLFEGLWIDRNTKLVANNCKNIRVAIVGKHCDCHYAVDEIAFYLSWEYERALWPQLVLVHQDHFSSFEKALRSKLAINDESQVFTVTHLDGFVIQGKVTLLVYQDQAGLISLLKNQKMSFCSIFSKNKRVVDEIMPHVNANQITINRLVNNVFEPQIMAIQLGLLERVYPVTFTDAGEGKMVLSLPRFVGRSLLFAMPLDEGLYQMLRQIGNIVCSKNPLRIFIHILRIAWLSVGRFKAVLQYKKGNSR